MPDQTTMCSGRQSDQDVPFASLQPVGRSDLATRMRYLPTDVSQLPRMRFDPYDAEAGGIAVDTEDGPEKFDIRAGSPGMTIGTRSRYIRHLRPGRKSHPDVFPPFVEPARIIIAVTCHDQRAVEIIFKINAGLCKTGIFDHATGYGTCFRTFDYAGQYRQ